MFRYMFVFLLFVLSIPAWSQKSVDVTASEEPHTFLPGTTSSIVSLSFTNITGQAKLNSWTITRSGTATDTDVPTANLWEDTNGDGIGDNLLTTVTFSGGVATFSPLTKYALSTGTSWLITYDVSAGANPSATAGCSFNDTDITGAGGTTVNLTNGTSFSTGDQSLPVELSIFVANVEKDQVTLKWTTESETNNLGFELWRSDGNADDFVILSSYQTNTAMQGQGNTNIRTEYSYSDNSVDKGVTYWYKLVDVDYNGLKIAHGPISAALNANAVNGFDLQQNYPNPFNPNTSISFSVPNSRKDNVHVILSVFNNLGQEVATIFDGPVNSGNDYVFNWDGRDNFGRRLASGVYTYSLRSENFVSSMKMVLLK